MMFFFFESQRVMNENHNIYHILNVFYGTKSSQVLLSESDSVRFSKNLYIKNLSNRQFFLIFFHIN